MKQDEISIEMIRYLAKDRKNIEMTLHVLDRCRQRGISFLDIENCLLNGEIIEEYVNDHPFPSCLELGASISGVPLHVCVGIGGGKLWIITAYHPSEDEWEDGFRLRKGRLI